MVDVNTGKFVGSGGNLEETVTKNNIEAAEEIVRQLRLRDIGGIIVIDFIDMVLESNRDLRGAPPARVPRPGPHQAPGRRGHLARPGPDDPQAGRQRPDRGVLRELVREHCNGRGSSSTPSPSRSPRVASPAEARSSSSNNSSASRSRRGQGRWRGAAGPASARPAPVGPHPRPDRGRRPRRRPEEHLRPGPRSRRGGPGAGRAGARGRRGRGPDRERRPRLLWSRPPRPLWPRSPRPLWPRSPRPLWPRSPSPHQQRHPRRSLWRRPSRPPGVASAAGSSRPGRTAQERCGGDPVGDGGAGAGGCTPTGAARPAGMPPARVWSAGGTPGTLDPRCAHRSDVRVLSHFKRG